VIFHHRSEEKTPYHPSLNIDNILMTLTTTLIILYCDDKMKESSESPVLFLQNFERRAIMYETDFNIVSFTTRLLRPV